jgi:hypothetical protein
LRKKIETYKLNANQTKEEMKIMALENVKLSKHNKKMQTNIA